MRNIRVWPRSCGAERAIDEVPAIVSGLGFEESPADAEIGERSVGIVDVLERAFEGLVGDGVAFGPLLTFVEGVAVEALEGGEADAGVDEDVVDFFGANDFDVLG